MDMDEALAKRIEMLEKVRSNVTDVKQSCQRVEKQMTALAQQQGKLEMSAVQARRLGREDLARMALAKRDEAQMQLAQLKEQYKRLLAAEVKLAAAAQALEEKINALAENRLGREKASKRTSPQYIVVKVLTNAFSIRAWAQRSESQVLHLARTDEALCPRPALLLLCTAPSSFTSTSTTFCGWMNASAYVPSGTSPGRNGPFGAVRLTRGAPELYGQRGG
jgi:hypothetical protein